MFIHEDYFKVKILEKQICEKGNETPGFIFINPGSIE